MTTNDQIFELINEQSKFNRNVMKYLRRIVAKLDDPDGTKAAERSKNNAFNRLMRASDELCIFMGVPKGSEMSRSQGNKAVYAYIRDNNLKVENDGRRFNPDNKLRSVFGISDDETEMITLGVSKLVSKHLTALDAADPADKNGDGRVTRSEAQEHREAQATAGPSQPKKTPTKTTKSATIRAPPKKKTTA